MSANTTPFQPTDAVIAGVGGEVIYSEAGDDNSANDALFEMDTGDTIYWLYAEANDCQWRQAI